MWNFAHCRDKWFSGKNNPESDAYGHCAPLKEAWRKPGFAMCTPVSLVYGMHAWLISKSRQKQRNYSQNQNVVGKFSMRVFFCGFIYSQARMVLEKSATLLFVWLTPLGVKLCSQVCGELGSTHAWISVFLDFTTEHAVGVRIVPQTCMACLPFHLVDGVFHTVEQSAHLRRAPSSAAWISETRHAGSPAYLATQFHP